MEIEIYLQGHKFVASSIEEVDQTLQWFKPWKSKAPKETPKKQTGISMDLWRKSRIRRWGVK